MTKADTRPPAPPAIAIDWDERRWRDDGARVLELVAAASTQWQDRSPAPEDADRAETLFTEALPEDGLPLDQVLDRIEQQVLPSSAFNAHPRWLAYIMGSPAPITVVGNLIASALNQNTGLWRVTPSATAIEVQTVGWIASALGMPATTEGVFVSGGQMANIVAQNVMRDSKAPWDFRRYGARGPEGGAPQLRVYVSSERHYCHEQAAELLGLGREAVRIVPVDEAYRMRVDALAAMLAEDRGRGDMPIGIVATAGTVGTGAIDPIPELVAVARAEKLWLHVDGAYGAFGVLAGSAPSHLHALADADSVACDPHKWLYSAIDAGVVLVREPGALERSFAFHASYLETADRGVRVELLERTPENSRPQRAFKVWLALQSFGRRGYAELIDYNIRLAAYMEQRIAATPGLALAAPRELSIVCWRAEPAGVRTEDLDALQTGIIAELEHRGIAMISNATLRDGRTAMRACITNFRTSAEDIDAIVAASAEIAAELTKR
jgi:glutamate/tyrosine decarboxylase-like PLP-dependent enzyme